MTFTESAVLRKVRAFIAIAEHPNTDPIEAKAAADKADELMRNYAINEAIARSAVGIADRALPGTLFIDLGQYNALATYVADVADAIARHLRCKIRHYVKYDNERRAWMSKVYGFEHDLRFFEVMYTVIRLHMIDALRPKWDPALSMEDNCYALHAVGYNWLQIAELRGWHKRGWNEAGFDPDDERYGKECWIGPDGELKSNWQLGSMHKRAYQRACKVRGEETKVIHAGETDTYRASAARGYAVRINQRLHRQRAEANTEPGTDLVLRDAFADVQDFFKEDNPDLYKVYEPGPECEKCKKNPSGSCRDHPRGRAYRERPFSQAGYSAGTRVADTADLMAGDTVRNTTKAVSG